MLIRGWTFPQDATWKRLALRDIIDTNLGVFAFLPEWYFNLTVYYYVVPKEETTWYYTEPHISYLKLSCSITRCNPSEELTQIKNGIIRNSIVKKEV
ncbi:MAG: hypothetical protein AB7V56_06475 [Candidatus Nitrosocosmicus sp.]